MNPVSFYNNSNVNRHFIYNRVVEDQNRPDVSNDVDLGESTSIFGALPSTLEEQEIDQLHHIITPSTFPAKKTLMNYK